MPEKFVEVALPLPLRGAMTYHLPSSFKGEVIPGQLLKVPLGTKQVVGCLLGETKKPKFPTKEVLEFLDPETFPPLSELQLKLMHWASAYYLTPIGEVLRHLLPSALLHPKPAPKIKRSPKPPLPETPESQDAFATPPIQNLSAEQTAGLKTIIESLQPILLHGITGSGKTEIYIEAIRQALENGTNGGQALVLVPEIGLTPQLIGRFRHLPVPVTAYHSGLTDAQRFQVWNGVRTGETRLVVGTRSAIFLPFSALKMIIIDEEHDSSYKQEERFCYHARDLALWRAQADDEKIPVILGSATPSLESFHRAESGKMKKVRLATRPSGVLPKLETVDRRLGFKKDPIFSEILLEALGATLKKKEQSLIFLNRRGFSLVLCADCGFIPRCTLCDISFTLHKKSAGESVFVCHYCDATLPYHPLCSDCKKGAMISFGCGTEKVESELQKLFPGAKIARMDRDSTRGKNLLKILEKMKKKEIDILIGTQMITKGHDYPDLTLVGIIDADIALHLPDFRATERTFQMITQVSGRAGRGKSPGQVFIQTFQPDHEGLAAAISRNEELFYARELKQRREAGYPPFKRLIEIRLSATRRETVVSKIRDLSRKLQKILGENGEDRLLGPSPCPVERVRGKTRWRLLLKTGQYAKIQPRLRSALDDFAEKDLPSRMKMLINVDPVDMM